MGPFPGPKSVLLLDGCGVHHTRAVHDAVHDVGAIIVFLEPYDPQHMPIEIGFRAAKDWLRGEGRRFYKHMPRREQLRLALANVARGAGRNALRESGYEV